MAQDRQDSRNIYGVGLFGIFPGAGGNRGGDCGGWVARTDGVCCGCAEGDGCVCTAAAGLRRGLAAGRCSVSVLRLTIPAAVTVRSRMTAFLGSFYRQFLPIEQ